MFENMMYFHSQQFKILKKLIVKKNINKIDIKFSIPNFSKKSFRKNNSLDSSILYDMGCYPFSLISYFNFNNKNYKVSYTLKNKKITSIEVKFISKKINFKITLAIFKKYENYIKIYIKDNTYYQFNHFFYGKKIKKVNYRYNVNKKINISKINEENLFKKIFSLSCEKILELSNKQFFLIKNYLGDLNTIKKYIKQ